MIHSESLPQDYSIRTLNAGELNILRRLFSYNDIEAMVSENARAIEGGIIDIFGLFHNGTIIGELHVKYESDDEREAVKGRRAYLFAFRVHEDFQNLGLGKCLLRNVIKQLTAMGYSELTIGVEDDNPRAAHIYFSFGFTELVARKLEEYQGDSYEYNLYLRHI